jgi:hypothetical protein
VEIASERERERKRERERERDRERERERERERDGLTARHTDRRDDCLKLYGGEKK